MLERSTAAWHEGPGVPWEWLARAYDRLGRPDDFLDVGNSNFVSAVVRDVRFGRSSDDDVASQTVNVH